ncbi:hypothetical protein IQ06DRAFT_102450 [Phaeosphaeriaceae sp. SRC1lsM3a]|nr:hypothetical protein IQ06DRAFT_102450 [Stagonospora sp. SRC1lsM3a]
MARTRSTATTPPPPFATPRRSSRVALERAQQRFEPKRDATTIDSEILEQYSHEISTQGTKCGSNWSNEEADSDDEPLAQKPKRQNTSTAPIPTGVKTESEEINYGNLPLIDVWVAKAKGWAQEEVEALPGFKSEGRRWKEGEKNEEDEKSKEVKKEDEGEDEDEVPISFVLCDGGATQYVHIDPSEFTECNFMPLPDEEDANL